MVGAGNFPMNNLGKLVHIVKMDESVVRGFFMQYKPDKVYISMVDSVVHEWVKLEDIASLTWE